MTQTVKCRMPSCHRRVNASNAAGVCQAHLHSSKCLCGDCPQNRGQRPGTQTVMVREAPGCSWGQAVAAPVTLPLAPWERVG